MSPQRAFTVLWLGQFAAVAGLTVVVPLLPFYLAELGTRPQQVAWWTGVSLAAPAVTQMLTGPLWGWVGDRYGRKAMVVRAHAGLALSLGLMALAATPDQFLAARLLQGACGGVVAASATFASSLAPPGRRGRALGGLFSATATGSLLGPLLGSLLAARFGFGALFAGVAVLLLASSVLAVAVLREPASPAEPSRPGLSSVRTVTAQLFRSGQARALVVAGLAGQAAVYALVVVFAPRVGQISGSIGEATVWVGALQAVTWAGSLAGAPWWGARNDRSPPQRSFAWAAAVCGAAVVLQAFPSDPQLLVPLRIVQGLCFAALAQSVLHVACQVVPEPARGSGLGITSSLLELGQVLGPLFGALVAYLLPPPGAFSAIGALFVLAAALAARSTQLARQPTAAHAGAGAVR
ncbi:MAG: MFS transporter [Pseudonocardiaceae bacterium]